MRRLLIITPSYDPRLGGVEKHVWQTSQLLKNKGWQISILTEHFDHLKNSETKDGIKIYRLNFPKKRFLGLLVIWWKLLINYWQLIQQADVIHIHDVFVWYLPFKLLCWRKKVVTTFHGWEGTFPIPKKNIWWRQLGAMLSNKNVAVGKYLEKYYHFHADEIIYGGVESPKKLPRKEKLLLFVGRLDYDTGLPILLQALEQKAWSGKVIFCGDGILREQAEQLGEVTGFTDPAPYFKRAQVVFAGGYLSILEALAFRCRVIVAQKNPLKKDYYLMSPFAPWIMVASTVPELVRKLSGLVSLSVHDRQIIKQAAEWTKTQTWQAIAKIYLKLYQELS